MFFFKRSEDLEVNASHEFKYVIDGACINEMQAEGQALCDFTGSENSVTK